MTRAFWPLWSVAFLVLGALFLGLQDIVAVETVWAGGALAGLAGLFLLVRGTLRFRAPRRAEVYERLDATMPGRPIQAMLDAQAIGQTDPASRAVWEAHQRRMTERARGAKPVAPDLRVSRRDPFGLRYMALLAMAVGLLFGSFWRVGSVAEMSPLVGEAQAAAGPSWEGWVEPPAYTGLPVLYLADLAGETFEAPVGSRVTLRLYGEPGALGVEESVSDAAAAPPPADPAMRDFAIARAGRLEITGPGGRGWEITILPDAAPLIEATGPAEASAIGAFTMPFAASDDYEVLSGQARISLDIDRLDRRYGLALDPEDAAPITIDLPMPVARSRQEFEEVLIEDFSDHPWANLPVEIELLARDAGGNEGRSASHETDLAARHFFDPMAAAVIEMRRDLLWNRDNRGRIAQVLRAISHDPEDGLFDRETDFLRLRFILRRIEAHARAMPDETRDEIAEAMWELALKLEEGTLADALARMRQAQEKLAEALKNGASDAEIARLMDELREATRDYMNQLQREFAQQNRNNTDQPDNGERNDNMTTMNQDDIQRMMDRIQELMEQGRMAEAQQALQEFQEMMENMRITEGQGGEGQSPGQQALEGLADTLREQQGLSDQAFRDLQEQFNPNAGQGENQGNRGRSGNLGQGQSHEPGQQQGQGQGQAGRPGQPGQPGQPNQPGQQGQQPGQNQQPGQGGQQGQSGSPQDLAQSLADRQRALRQQLDQQRRGLPGAGSEQGDAARDALDRAGRAMDGAEEALRQDDLAEAIDKQSEAMENLREGMRNLGEALAQEGRRQQGQQGSAPENSAGRQRADPLGRNQRGTPGVEDSMLQGEDVYRRARDLLDEIRRRSGDLSRPEAERSYLERLLDRF